MKQWTIVVGAILIAAFGVAWFVNQPPAAPDFTDYKAGQERKEVFFDYFLPLVQQHNDRIIERRQQIKQWSQQPKALGWWDERTLDEWLETYRIEDFDASSDEDWQRLLRKVDIVPPSLALAQAANESAWGTSRFARKGNNYFGQWCFSEGCGLVPNSRDSGADHEVAAFDSPKESVERYMLNLNSHPAYRQLRQIRTRLRSSDKPVTGIALAAGLKKYSERGQEYIDELRSMIRYNELDQHDHPDLARL